MRDYKYFSQADIVNPVLGEARSPEELERLYSRNLFQAWRPPTQQQIDEQMSYSQMARDYMDAPDRDTFLWRILNLALQEFHKNKNYVWKPQYQKRGTCFVADTLVTMADGTKKPIQSVRVGDRVLTHRGRDREVTGTGLRYYDGPLFTIRHENSQRALTLTEEHPVYASVDLSLPGSRLFDSSTWQWLETCELTTNTIVFLPDFQQDQRHSADYPQLAGYDAQQLGHGNTALAEMELVGTAARLAEINSRLVSRQKVFNLEVDEDHSYVAEGLAVHNCVGQGHKLGVDMVMAVNWLVNQAPFPGRSAVAPIYAGSRVEIAGRPGGWDGSNGYWAVGWLTKWGVVLLSELELPDDSRDEDERLAVRWTATREGVPAKFETMAKVRPIVSAPKITKAREAGKAIQAGHPVANCSNLIPSSKRNAQGFSALTGRGGHCTLFSAVRYNPFGLLYQNSWNGWASGGKFPADQPEGSVWLDERSCDRILSQGDSHALIGISGLSQLPFDGLYCG